MAEHHRHILRPAPRQVEPWQQVAAGRAGVAFLVLEVHRPVRRAQAHARERIDDAAQARVAGQGIVPAVGLVAVHLAQERDPAVALERALDFAGQRHRLRRIPLGRHARVHQQVILDEHRQRPRAQPGDQFLAVRRVQDLVQRIGAAQALRAARHRNQVQVVVAEQGIDPSAARFVERLHAPQRHERFGTAVDQVADKEDACVAACNKRDAVEQQLRFMRAALEVANGVGGHIFILTGHRGPAAMSLNETVPGVAGECGLGSAWPILNDFTRGRCFDASPGARSDKYRRPICPSSPVQ